VTARWDSYDRPEYRRLLAAARRSLERTGWDLSGSISVGDPDERERNAIIGITGRHRRPGVGRIQVSLTDLDAAVRSGTGLSLTELLDKIGPPLHNRPVEAAKHIAAREAALSEARASPLHETAEWYRTWLDRLSRDGTLRRLLGRHENALVLMQATKVLEYLDNRPGNGVPAMLPELSAAVTGDTKALNHGTSLSTLVIRALAIRAGTAKPATAQERRDLWERFGVVVDDLASRVLVLNLPAAGDGLGEWLTGAAQRGTPFYVTLHQLMTLPITVTQEIVYTCENPAVLRRAAAELGPRSLPLICTEGRPSVAFHQIMKAVCAGGARARCHGDFDWPGVAIVGDIIDRHEAAAWRMSAADYLASVVTKVGEPVRLTGSPVQTPWDPALAAAMKDNATVLYEEAIADSLLTDLSQHRR
jgi:uncharacterized protein (TIGR02679 family)